MAPKTSKIINSSRKWTGNSLKKKFSYRHHASKSVAKMMLVCFPKSSPTRSLKTSLVLSLHRRTPLNISEVNFD